jgi:hypothetical protein
MSGPTKLSIFFTNLPRILKLPHKINLLAKAATFWTVRGHALQREMANIAYNDVALAGHRNLFLIVVGDSGVRCVSDQRFARVLWTKNRENCGSLKCESFVSA